jgi:uncharacterized protein
MIEQVQKILKKTSEFEIKHFYLMIMIFSVLTLFALVGLTKIQFQSDLSKNNPTDLPIIKLDDRIKSQFSEGNSPIIVLIELDDTSGSQSPLTDIRDPKVIQFTSDLKQELLKEKKVRSVFAISDFFPYGIPSDLKQVKTYLANVPQSESVINKKYSMTAVFITTDLSGADEAKVREINDRIAQVIDSSPKPGGVKISITGEPPLAASIFRLIINDAVLTLIIAAILIFLLLLFLERSFSKAVAIIAPLLFGLLFTLGALGWTSTPISIATAGLSAMLLGLGVEYSIFLFSRFSEEREKHTRDKSIVIAVSTTGASTASSGLTAVIGFAVLMFSSFPMLSQLGFTLALGIFIILVSIITISPIVMIIEERVSGKCKIDETIEKSETYFEKYGDLLSRKPLLFILIPILITIIMFFGVFHIQSKDINFNNVLPSDLPELIAFNKIGDELTSTNSVSIYIELNPTYTNSDEPRDIRDPKIINYINVLSEKSRTLPYFESISSISEYEKNINNGLIPNEISNQKRLLEKSDVSNLVSKDYSSAIIQITLNKDSDNHKSEVINELKKIISETNSPSGVYVVASGGIVVDQEVNSILGPDSAKTAVYAFIIIIVLLLVLTRSIKYTILPLLTVVFSVIWTLGLIGLLQIPFNPITSTVLSMTIGVGIDFGIQISMRYVLERKNKNKKEAMKQTLKNTLYPLTITLIAALIGFRAMSLGKLKIMQELGNVISLGILSSMLVAVTLVSAIIVLLDRKE